MCFRAVVLCAVFAFLSVIINHNVWAAELWQGQWGASPEEIKQVETRKLKRPDGAWDEMYGVKVFGLEYSARAADTTEEVIYIFEDNKLALVSAVITLFISDATPAEIESRDKELRAAVSAKFAAPEINLLPVESSHNYQTLTQILDQNGKARATFIWFVEDGFCIFSLVAFDVDSRAGKTLEADFNRKMQSQKPQ